MLMDMNTVATVARFDGFKVSALKYQFSCSSVSLEEATYLVD